MGLQARHKLIKDRKDRIEVRKFSENGREHFNIGLWLDGTNAELDSIEEVSYELHPSFRDRIRRSKDRDNKFAISIWTWGVFEINVTVVFNNGRPPREIPHNMNFTLPEDTGSNYLEL